MEYIFQNGSSRWMCRSASVMRRCAVELTGRNSVRPSTTPNNKESRYSCKNRPWVTCKKLFAIRFRGVGGNALLQRVHQFHGARLPVDKLGVASGGLGRNFLRQVHGFFAPLVAFFIVLRAVHLHQRCLAPCSIKECFRYFGRL